MNCSTGCGYELMIAIPVYYILQRTAYRQRLAGAPFLMPNLYNLPAQPRSRAKAERPRVRTLETYHKREVRFALCRTPLEIPIQPASIPCLRTLLLFQSLLEKVIIEPKLCNPETILSTSCPFSPYPS